MYVESTLIANRGIDSGQCSRAGGSNFSSLTRQRGATDARTTRERSPRLQADGSSPALIPVSRPEPMRRLRQQQD